MVYVTRVKVYSILCIGCQKRVLKICSGLNGALKKLEGTFKYKRYVNGMVNREAVTGLNDGIERVESFVYLGDKLYVDGGWRMLSVVTARIRV